MCNPFPAAMEVLHSKMFPQVQAVALATTPIISPGLLESAIRGEIEVERWDEAVGDQVQRRCGNHWAERAER